MRLGNPGIDEDPSVETIEEIKILRNNYAAEYGASAGGVIITALSGNTSVTTRSTLPATSLPW